MVRQHRRRSIESDHAFPLTLTCFLYVLSQCVHILSYIDFRLHSVVFLQDTFFVLLSGLLFLSREATVEMRNAFYCKRLYKHQCHSAYDSLSSETWLTMWSNIQGESSYSELRIAIAYAAEKNKLVREYQRINSKQSTFFNLSERLRSDYLLLVKVVNVRRQSLEIWRRVRKMPQLIRQG